MKRALSLLTLGILLIAPALLQAAESAEGHHGIDAGRLALQLLNFGVLIFILVKFAGGAMNKALRARHEQLKADLQEAQRLREAAEARFKQQEGRLANLQQEIATLRTSIQREAEQEKARIIAAAEERARRIQDDTKFQLDQQVKEAELRLRSEVASAAVKIAEELLKRSVAAGDEQRLVQSFVADLGARPGHAAHGAGEPARPTPVQARGDG